MGVGKVRNKKLSEPFVVNYTFAEYETLSRIMKEGFTFRTISQKFSVYDTNRMIYAPWQSMCRALV